MFDSLAARVEGDILTGAFDRGRYATDASIYQIIPQAVLVPKRREDLVAAVDFARDQDLPLTLRGGGTSQSGQTVNSGLIVDCSKHLNRILSLDVQARRCVVEPGIVLSELNRQLKPHGLWFPVDVSTASRATIGGMTGNNSCGSRSLKYGIMRHNVERIEAVMADGTDATFSSNTAPAPYATALEALGAREADEIAAHFPSVQRRVGGYNIDAFTPRGQAIKHSDILLGSEGTLAVSTAIELKLWPLPVNKTLGVCHFPTFYAAMDAAQHLVKLGPVAVELVDHNMIRLGRDIPMFRATMDQVVRGNPAALLLVEFAEDDDAENQRRLSNLHQAMGDLGFDWSNPEATRGGVVDAIDPGFQKRIWDIRAQGLNIMMSMKEAGKPISFVEDCAVPLEHLAAYTEQLTDVFERNGTSGTWYAHASEGTLHVRPILNLKLDKDAKTMRAIAEEAFELVRKYKGAHSGEHGDGIVRSEFHKSMFGSRLARSFEDVKTLFDPTGFMNPGKIVHAPKMDDRSLFRYHQDYAISDAKPVLDWSAFTGGATGLQGAVEMCNNNGACRKFDAGVMCPSYRVTNNERDVVRGRANSLRLALSGQLGSDALASDEMAETMQLCVGCKACQRECPTGVDMARMKIEVDAARVQKHGSSLFQRLVGEMPRYARLAGKIAPLMNLANRMRLQRFAGFTADRKLPEWSARPFRQTGVFGPEDGDPVVLFVDSFNRAFEPELVSDALEVLVKTGHRVTIPDTPGRPLCCGKTYLATGAVDKARNEAQRLLDGFAPYVAEGQRIVGLEPSCSIALIDELPALMPGEKSASIASSVVLFAELMAERLEDPSIQLKPLYSSTALLHGHCHEKAKAKVNPILKALSFIPNLETTLIDSSCCGMAGSFGYNAQTAEVSKQMAELSLLPAVRAADDDAIIIASGTSCRHQIADGSGRKPLHLASVLAQAL